MALWRGAWIRLLTIQSGQSEEVDYAECSTLIEEFARVNIGNFHHELIRQVFSSAAMEVLIDVVTQRGLVSRHMMSKPHYGVAFPRLRMYQVVVIFSGVVRTCIRTHNKSRVYCVKELIWSGGYRLLVTTSE